MPRPSPGLAVLLLLVAACGRSEPPLDGRQTPITACYDSDGLQVGPYLQRSDGDGYCAFLSGSVRWRVNPGTGDLGPVDDQVHALVFTGPACTGLELVLCFPTICSLDTFRTADGEIRAATSGAMSTRELASVRSCKGGEICSIYNCQERSNSLVPLLSLPTADAPVQTPPSVHFRPPLTYAR